MTEKKKKNYELIYKKALEELIKPKLDSPEKKKK